MNTARPPCRTGRDKKLNIQSSEVNYAYLYGLKIDACETEKGSRSKSTRKDNNISDHSNMQTLDYGSLSSV